MLETLLNQDDLRFRDEVRRFIETRVSPQLRQRVANGEELAKADYVGWQQALAEQGWLTTTWPLAEGGCEWTPVRHYLFEEELALGDCPPVGLTLGVGAKLLGPILCEFGTAEQRMRLFPGIRESTTWWCQGYSEPGAGPTWLHWPRVRNATEMTMLSPAPRSGPPMRIGPTPCVAWYGLTHKGDRKRASRSCCWICALLG